MIPHRRFRRVCAWAAASVWLSSGSVYGQTVEPSPPPAVRAARAYAPPTIDGDLGDATWATAPVVTGFRQRDPDEGQVASERSEIRFLFDDDALYVGARLFDSEPDLIARRLSTRDGDADADRVIVYLDPMHDRLTGAAFQVSAANVQSDAVLYNDTWLDNSWDAVWQSAVSVDDAGWSAEIRIPLSQLRFPAADRHVWGVNVERVIRRKNESAWLEMVPKEETGLASRMRDMTGLDGLRPARRIELLPYAASRAEFVAPLRAEDPFNDGSRVFASAGLDLKWGLTSNLTLDATVNPDFGQVEVDPAVVNLTAFETFFPEKRSFFLEGAQIFENFGLGGSNSFWGFNSSDPQIFYSRRIGRAPQLAAAGDFTDAPTATTILGAAKLTGKTPGGWSVGLLEAVTAEESARTWLTGVDGQTVVEPFTNYAVARLQREIGRRAGAGFIVTSVARRLDTERLEIALPDTAVVAGGDGYVFLDADRTWVLTGKLATSYVAGSPVAMTRAQLAPQRYYQRPDATHVALDPTRTSLAGTTGRLVLNRNSGAWFVNAALWGVSPGFESNDLGFQGAGDRAGAHAVFFWRGVQPNRLTRSRQAWVAKWWTWNYARELQGDGFNGQASVTFLNYWSAGGNAGLQRPVLDDRLTRGGPSAAYPGSAFWNVFVATDSRQPVSVEVSGNRSWSDGGSRSLNANLSLVVKPSPNWTVSTGPQWSRSTNVAQYVRAVVDPTATATFGGRYVFGTIDQTQLSLTTRVNVILSSTVSVQVFMQPLLAVGDYSVFKELARPRTFDFLDYGAPDRPLSYDPRTRIYTADPDGPDGPAESFRFLDPDFNVKSLRLNAVFRWEFQPGSALYAVWTRQQQDFADPGSLALGRDAGALFAAPGDDVVLVKIAYWLGR